ncbi:LytR/AlgR family response regulator transcription factor [Marinoscillum sp.]|uniref:LytR/AlgR family response regulator transcription factor n=1 Tax=Marinoscillum sp. TaxID=2024838 RepID=UPI003BAA8329
MEKVKILVVEDEFIIAEEIIAVLNQNQFDVVGKARNADAALQIAKEKQPDIVICDINIDGDKDGIELARELRKTGNLGIIFLTAFDDAQYLERASEVEPSAYIVKPFEQRNLIVAIKLAFRNLASANTDENEEDAFFVHDRIFIKEGSRFNKLMVDQIDFVEAVGSYCDIYTGNKKITLTINLKHFISKLDHPHFMRVHRSYLINFTAIDSFEGNMVYIGEHKIPISASHKEEFLKLIRTI